MSEHVEVLRDHAQAYRCIGNALGSPASIRQYEEKALALEAAANHAERCEAALRASTRLLRGFAYDTSGAFLREILNQIAANEAALGDKHD